MIAPEHRSAGTPTRSMEIVRANSSEKHEGVLTKRPIREVPHQGGLGLLRPGHEALSLGEQVHARLCPGEQGREEESVPDRQESHHHQENRHGQLGRGLGRV